MKRFRVVKAAHIAFAAAALLLLAVIIVLAMRYVQAADAVRPAGNFAMEAAEAAFVASEMEIELLPEGVRTITLELGVRFLTDWLNGDKYFAIKYPEHNLDRCRAQFALAADIENKMERMKEIVNELSGN